MLYLQLGFELKGMLEETVCIEDLSGHESCWKLVDETATVTTPQDSEFLLPDNSSIWSALLSNSCKEDMLVPFNKGHLAWCGTQTLNRPIDGWQYFEVSNELLIDHTTNIRKFTFILIPIFLWYFIIKKFFSTLIVILLSIANFIYVNM